MKGTCAIFPAVLALCSCASAPVRLSWSEYKVRWISPTGNVSLAFYDQGSNEDWVSSSDAQNVVRPALGTDVYDAVCFDGIAGLTILKNNPSWNYKLISWISQGTFYLVSTKHGKGDPFLEGTTIDAFVQGGNASKAFRNLAASKWDWDLSIASTTYQGGVAQVAQTLINAPDTFDYYVIAEPAYIKAKGALAQKGIVLNEIYDLQAEWLEKYGTKIPAGGLFVNERKYAEHKGEIDRFLLATDNRIATLYDDKESIAEALDAFEEETGKTADRFGITGDQIKSLGAERLGLLKKSDVSDAMEFANAFQAACGDPLFSIDQFIR